MAQVQIIRHQRIENKKSNVPVTTDWHGVKMIRAHSITATVKEILQVNMYKDVVRVGIVGDMGSGKSTLAMTLAHLVHEESNLPFAVKVFDRNALLNFKETISNLESANYVIIIDDASFLSAQASKQKMDGIKQDITEIRHYDNLVGKKIIFIINWHYEYGLDKMIRSTDFRYCTSVGISDTDNLAKIVSAKYLPKIMQFQQMCVSAMTSGQYSFQLGKNLFTYDYRKPHIPLLFYNKKSLRFVVSPTRQFVDPICNLCSNAENKMVQSDLDVNPFLEKLAVHFKTGTVKMALRAVLLSGGVNVYPTRAKQCMRAISNYFAHRIINLDELAKAWELKDEETKLKKKIDYDEGLTAPELEPLVLVEKIVLKPIEFTAIELVKPVQLIQTTEPKNGYTEYDSWNYESIITELENMLKLPPDEIEREKYEYLNGKARDLIGIANNTNS